MGAGQDGKGEAERDGRKEADAPPGPDAGNSLEDASREAVEEMEQGDEPGHAGRGDAG